MIVNKLARANHVRGQRCEGSIVYAQSGNIDYLVSSRRIAGNILYEYPTDPTFLPHIPLQHTIQTVSNYSNLTNINHSILPPDVNILSDNSRLAIVTMPLNEMDSSRENERRLRHQNSGSIDFGKAMIPM